MFNVTSKSEDDVELTHKPTTFLGEAKGVCGMTALCLKTGATIEWMLNDTGAIDTSENLGKGLITASNIVAGPAALGQVFSVGDQIVGMCTKGVTGERALKCSHAVGKVFTNGLEFAQGLHKIGAIGMDRQTSDVVGGAKNGLKVFWNDPVAGYYAVRKIESGYAQEKRVANGEFSAQEAARWETRAGFGDFSVALTAWFFHIITFLSCVFKVAFEAWQIYVPGFAYSAASIFNRLFVQPAATEARCAHVMHSYKVVSRTAA